MSNFLRYGGLYSKNLGMFRGTWAGLVVVVAALVLVEIYAASSALNAVILPAPSRVLVTYAEPGFATHIAGQAVVTLLRAALGFSLAILIAVPLGLAMGSAPVVQNALTPSVELLRPIPSSAMVPVAILFLGLGSQMIIFVIWFGTMWPLLLNSMYGAQSVSPRHRELAHLTQMGLGKFFFMVVLPSAVPHIFAGVRVALSIALILAVTAEMLAGQDGIGFYLLDYERAFQYHRMYAVLVLLAIVGLCVNGALVLLQRKLVRRFPSLG